MHKLLRCRRSLVCLVGIVSCLGINLSSGADTSGAIAMICGALAGANAYEGGRKQDVAR